MKLDKKLAQMLLVGLGLADLFITSLEVALVTFGIAAILFGLTQSLEVSIVVLIAPLAVKASNMLLSPDSTKSVNMESFQVKDAATVAARLQSIQVAQPKIEGPTGVLESPSILNSQPLVGMKALASEALPGASIPAASGARVMIYTPEETTVAATGMRVVNPLANPVLQNGPDSIGVTTALTKTGAAFASGPADIAGVAGSAGNAF